MRAAFLLAVPPLGVLAAAIATSGNVHREPSLVWLACAAFAAIAAILLPESARRLGAPAAALAAGIAAGHVLLRAGVPHVHDLHHLAGIWAYGSSVHEGSILPLWIPHLGFGMPLLVFYGPVNFLLTLPWILAGLDPVGAWKASMLAAHAGSALSAYAAARILGAGARGGVVAAVALAFSPWRLCVADYRGAVAEANAFLFLPLVAAGVVRSLSSPTRPLAILTAAATGLLILTHPLSVLTLGLALVPAAVVAWWRPSPACEWPRGRRLAATAAPLAVAAGLTAAWWVPALVETRHTALPERTVASAYFRYDEHGLAPRDLFSRRLWDRRRFALTDTQRAAGGEGQQMPFYFGIVLLAGAGLYAAASRHRTAVALAGSSLLAVALSSSALEAAGSLPGIGTLQFPWRFLTPASVLAALAIGVALDRLSEIRRWGPIALAAGIAALVWDGAPYTGAADTIPAYRGIVHAYLPDPKWTHWDESVQLVPVEVPRGAGVFRVADLMLPPSDYATPIDLTRPHYPEWLTPVLFAEYFATFDPARLGPAGISRFFVERRRDPVPIAAAPYASLRSGSGEAAVPFERASGRIVVRAEVPPPGGRLVVREQSFPGWTAQVDEGASTPTGDTGGFLSAELSPGSHRVVFEFGGGTPSRRSGLASSLLTLAGVLAWGFAVRPGARPRA